MTVQLYNSLTHRLEELKPLQNNTVGLYTCGPTVYNYAHIGNFRAYIFGDILKRTLLYNDYEVNHVMNLTDVDDKTIHESQATHTSLADFTTRYTEEFKKDAASLNIEPPTTYARAIDHIPEMVALIERLLEKGYAYKSDDGSVYFNVHKDKNYGQLSAIALSEKKENAAGRIKKDEYDKENADDFALWKAWSADDGDVFWWSSLGKGRPGWHIECSAMSMKYLGESFDIHTGGVDLIFPHHENEIAQSECATNKKFVNFWLHNEWVLVDGKKMAKSSGNYVTLRTIAERNINPLAYRYLLLQTHYRKQFNFTWESLEAAQNGLKHLYEVARSLPAVIPTGVEESLSRFAHSINEDLDIPNALGLIWRFIKEKKLDQKTLFEFDAVLGLEIAKNVNVQKIALPDRVAEFITARDAARASKNFAESDRLRGEIEALGYVVKDTKDGTRVSKN